MSRWVVWTLSAVIVSLMALSVVGEVWLMPREIAFVVRRFPETQPLLLPSLIWGVIVISSWQVVLAVGLWAMFREHRGLVVLTRGLTAWVASRFSSSSHLPSPRLSSSAISVTCHRRCCSYSSLWA